MAQPRFIVDEDFNNRILRGILRRQPELDIVRVQDSPVAQADDQTILAWASQEERVLLTHDVRTMLGHANMQIREGRHIAGVIAVPQNITIGVAIEDILTVAVCVSAEECVNRILYLPL